MRKTVELEIADSALRVVPTWEVIETWEDRVSIPDSLQRISQRKPLKYREIAWIIWAAIEYGQDDKAKRMPYAEIGDWVMANQGDAVVAASELLISAVSAGSEEARPKK